MGLDVFQVQDVIHEKGLYENSMNLVLDIVNNPGYVNPLAMRMAPPIMPPQYPGGQLGPPPM